MTGSLADAINSDVVTISISASEFVGIFDIEYNSTAPRNRISTRGGKLDTYGPPLIDIWCSAVLDADQIAVINTANTQNARRAYPATDTIIQGNSLSGSNSKDIVITFTAEYPDYKLLAPPGGLATAVRFHLISKNTPVFTFTPTP